MRFAHSIVFALIAGLAGCTLGVLPARTRPVDPARPPCHAGWVCNELQDSPGTLVWASDAIASLRR